MNKKLPPSFFSPSLLCPGHGPEWFFLQSELSDIESVLLVSCWWHWHPLTPWLRSTRLLRSCDLCKCERSDTDQTLGCLSVVTTFTDWCWGIEDWGENVSHHLVQLLHREIQKRSGGSLLSFYLLVQCYHPHWGPDAGVPASDQEQPSCLCLHFSWTKIKCLNLQRSSYPSWYFECG